MLNSENNPLASIAAFIPALPEESQQSINNVTTTANNAESMLTASNDLVIDCPEMRDLATEGLVDVVARKKQLNEMRLSVTRPMDAAKKAFMDIFRLPLEKLENAEKNYKKLILAYDQEVERQARAAQEKARKEAEAKQREIDRRAAEAAKKIQDEADKKAAEAASAGDEEEAEAIRQEAEEKAQDRIESRKHVQIQSVAPAPVIKGASQVKRWKCEVADKMELIKAVANGEAPPHLLDVNMKECTALARGLKEHLNIPGLKAFQDTSIAARSR